MSCGITRNTAAPPWPCSGFMTTAPCSARKELISSRSREINSFRAEHGAVVMKPLHGHGGAAVFRVMPQDMNFGSLFDMFSVTFREPWVIQRFLPEVKHGDKRIILVDGEFAGAVNRVPAPDDLRSNMVRGRRRASHRPHAARARNLRDARPGAARARIAVRRHRRDRRQPHRNQRHLPPTGIRAIAAARRAGCRWRSYLGHHREEARREIISPRALSCTRTDVRTRRKRR